MAPAKQLTFLWRIGTDHIAEPWISLEAFQHIPAKTAASARNQRVAIEEGRLRWTWSLPRKPKILLHSSSLQYSNVCIQWFCNEWKSWQAIVEKPCQESIAMRSHGCTDGLEPKLQETHGVKWIIHELCWSNNTSGRVKSLHSALSHSRVPFLHGNAAWGLSHSRAV